MKNQTPAYTPEGYTTVCPYLMVESIEKELSFLEAVFGAVATERLKNEQGIIQHAEARLGEVIIMMGRARAEWPATQGWNYVFVDNTDTTYSRALENGASSVLEPGDRFYGYREGGIRDPQGNTWWIAQVLEKLSEEEMQKRMKNFKA